MAVGRSGVYVGDGVGNQSDGSSRYWWRPGIPAESEDTAKKTIPVTPRALSERFRRRFDVLSS